MVAILNNKIAWLEDISHRPLMAGKGSVSFKLSIGQHDRIFPPPIGHEWQGGGVIVQSYPQACVAEFLWTHPNVTLYPNAIFAVLRQAV